MLLKNEARQAVQPERGWRETEVWAPPLSVNSSRIQRSLVMFVVYFYILVSFVAVSFFDSRILIEFRPLGLMASTLHGYIQCSGSHLLLLGIRQA